MPQAPVAITVGWGEALAALLGGLMVHIVSPMVTTWLKKPTEEFNQALQLREELRLQIADLHARHETLEQDLARVHAEVDEWRDKYYALLENNIKLQGQYNDLMEQFGTFKKKHGEDL